MINVDDDADDDDDDDDDREYIHWNTIYINVFIHGAPPVHMRWTVSGLFEVLFGK